ncbi:hypothetical protein VTK56DRAFT_9810 [Thermocarpiscus australiensis]
MPRKVTTRYTTISTQQQLAKVVHLSRSGATDCDSRSSVYVECPGKIRSLKPIRDSARRNTSCCHFPHLDSRLLGLTATRLSCRLVLRNPDPLHVSSQSESHPLQRTRHSPRSVDIGTWRTSAQSGQAAIGRAGSRASRGGREIEPIPRRHQTLRRRNTRRALVMTMV